MDKYVEHRDIHPGGARGDAGAGDGQLHAQLRALAEERPSENMVGVNMVLAQGPQHTLCRRICIVHLRI